MKNFIFSAVAMIAFVGSSRASSPVDNKISIMEQKIENSKTTATLLFDINCNLAQFKAYNDALSAGFSHAAASAAGYSVYFECKKFNLDQSSH